MKTKTSSFLAAGVDAKSDWAFKGKKPTLDELQKAVGGYIEVVYLPNSLVLVVNEDGLGMGLSMNVLASKMSQRPVVGPALLLSASLLT